MMHVVKRIKVNGRVVGRIVMRWGMYFVVQEMRNKSYKTIPDSGYVSDLSSAEMDAITYFGDELEFVQ